MSQTLSVLEMVLPVVIMLFIGYFCRVSGILTKDGLGGIKSVISNITLPVVLFQAFYATSYSLDSLFMFSVVFISCLLALGCGFLLNRFVPNSKLMPYLLSGFEVGMLGYALYGLLAGPDQLSYMATVDLGQVLFVFTIYLTLLKNATGRKPSLKEMLKEMCKNPAFRGVTLGLIVGVTGLGNLIASSPISPIFSAAIEMITLPTSAMILIIVGYELSLRKDLIVPVIKTLVFRTAVMSVLLCAASLIVFQIVPFDKQLFMALILLFSLPAPFVIPLYADVESEGIYISNTLSMGTLITILVFIGLSVYAVA